jgi:hypothetical protein
MITYFVVQPFQTGKRGSLLADIPMQATSKEHAERMAERMSRTKAGVVAFSRAGDPTTGEYEDAQIIAVYGSVPSEVAETMQAA